MSGRGTMTFSTGVSKKSKTLSIICCSSGSSTPARSLWRSSMRSSTSLWEPSSSSVGVMPSMRMTSCASQSRNVMNQLKTTKKTRIGTATASATDSARGSVYDFGTISPITTCRIVIRTNAAITEIAVETPPDTPPTALSSTRATAGSPSAPSASDESVMPSCIAEMKCDGSETIFRTVRARRLPSATSSSSRVWRTETNAYSAATKNAFQSTQMTMSRSSTAVSRLMRAPFGRARAGSEARRPCGRRQSHACQGAERRAVAAPGACSNVIDRRSSKREHSCGAGQPSTRRASRAWSASGSAGSRSSAWA